MDASPQFPEPSCPEITLKQVVDQIFLTRRITRRDQVRFMNVIATQDVLSSDDRLHLDRVFDALKRGLLRVVD